MNAKRLNERVEVELPIICTLEKQEQPIEVHGKIDDLSINGMKISFSNPIHAITSKVMDFVLELPQPFSKIKGNGEIQWKRWDANKQCTTCGIKLSPLNIDHLAELDTIISEINSSKHQKTAK